MSLLETRGMSQRFGGLQALQDVNIQINQNEIVGLIGPNGAGKSTLFNTILGLTPPTEGSVYFNGVNITNWPVHKVVAQGVAKTSQTVQVFEEMTVLENSFIGSLYYAKGLKDAREIALEKLRILELDHKKDRLAGDLTLAERAQLELARALTVNPKILMVDEMMAGLNEIEVTGMIERLKRINQEHNISILVIEHNMGAIMSLSNRVIVLEGGKVLVEGDPEMVSKDKRVVEAYLGVS